MASILSARIQTLESRRKTYEPLPSGVAPRVCSRDFRPGNSIAKSQRSVWDHKISEESSRRGGSTFKAAASASPNKTINLGNARPSSTLYPWRTMSMTSTGVSGKYEGNNIDRQSMSVSSIKQDDPYDLGVAMNYGHAAGSPQLLRFIAEHVELIHQPSYPDWECCLTCGTTSAMEIVFRMLCNRGDSMLVERYTYPGTIEVARSLEINLVEIEMDSDGPIPETVDSILQHWPATKGSKPSLLYTIPCGQNPTGITQSRARREAIYEIAKKHDLIIIEDDPYYYLPLLDGLSAEDPDQYVHSLPPSYLSLDQSGRVVRLDSTSKILSPGLRVGWITACSQLIDKFIAHTEFSTGAPSGPSQILLYKLLVQAWGHEGFTRWLCQLSKRYRSSCNVLVTALRRHLPRSLCRWTVPEFGMFVWIYIDLPRQDRFKRQETGIMCDNESILLAIENRIYENAKAKGVQVNKGSWFLAQKIALSTQLSFRMTFAAVPERDLEGAVERFGQALREEIFV